MLRGKAPASAANSVLDTTPRSPTGSSVLDPNPSNSSHKFSNFASVTQPSFAQILDAPKEKTFAVIGAGTIGASWCALFLAKGYTVRCYDVTMTRPDSAAAAQRACRGRIDANWEVLTKRGQVSQHADQDNITFHDSIAECVTLVDFVQENVLEDLVLKQRILAEIDLHTPPDILVASSTSFIPRDLLVLQCTVNPDRVIIGHPLQPHINPLVEVRAPQSNPATIAAAKVVYEQWMEMTMIILNKDVNGHIYNRLMGVLTKEALELVNSGACTAETVDNVTKDLGRCLQIGLARHMIIVGGPDYKVGGTHAAQGISVNCILTRTIVLGSVWMYYFFGDHWLTRAWIYFLQHWIVAPMTGTLNTMVNWRLRKFMVHCDEVLNEQTSWQQFMADVKVIYM